MDKLIKLIAEQIVERPSEVSVCKTEGKNTSVLELRVAKEDVGKVIGRNGRTAQAMRTILCSISSKTRRRTLLEIIE